MDNITFISLGEACDVKYQLEAKFKKFNNIEETYFFDWIISDFKTVLSVLNGKFLYFFTKENLIIDNSNKNYKCSIVTIKNFSTFRSLHDIPKDYNDDDIDKFIDKYIRRYNRFINLIKESNKKMFFIRKTKDIISNRDIILFYVIILKMNIKLNME